MREQSPREYAARAEDKLNYRYPGAGGESYMDLILRLDSIITMLEQVPRARARVRVRVRVRARVCVCVYANRRAPPSRSTAANTTARSARSAGAACLSALCVCRWWWSPRRRNRQRSGVGGGEALDGATVTVVHL